MFELIRDHSHKNNVYVLRNENNFYRKTSFDPHGINLLSNEIKGLNWYSKKNNTIKSRILFKYSSQSFFILDLAELNGKQINFTNPFKMNFKYLKPVMRHYFKHGTNNYEPVHGDLTFDNIIFGKNNSINIIDWEHFTLKKEPRGFDIVYLILSSIILPKINNFYVDEFEKNNLILIFKNLKSYINNKNLLYEPIDFFLDKFSSNPHWRNIIARSPHKLYPFKLAKKDIKIIQSILKSL